MNHSASTERKNSSCASKNTFSEPRKSDWWVCIPEPFSLYPGSSSRPTTNDLSCPKMSVNQSRMNSTPRSSTCAITSPAPVVLSGATAICRHLLSFVRLQHRLAFLAGPDPDRVLHGQDEQLPVADRARPGVPQDHLLDQADVVSTTHSSLSFGRRWT